jgi:hypothetical protein
MTESDLLRPLVTYSLAHKYTKSQRPLFADPGVGRPSDHAHSGIQITRFGTTPGGYIGDRVADHIGRGPRLADRTALHAQ